MKIEITINSCGANKSPEMFLRELAALIQESESFELNRSNNQWGCVGGGEIVIKVISQTLETGRL